MRRLAAMAAVLLLAGCGSDQQDLEQWVNEIKSRRSTNIEPIPQIQSYQAFVYRPEGRRDPFTAPRPRNAAAAGGGPQPDLDRNREPLEEFPLDSLRMLGTIGKGHQTYALIQSPDQVIHRVSVGSHLGQNFGEIRHISESEIQVAELVPDGFGGWIQRPATLALAE